MVTAYHNININNSVYGTRINAVELYTGTKYVQKQNGGFKMAAVHNQCFYLRLEIANHGLYIPSNSMAIDSSPGAG